MPANNYPKKKLRILAAADIHGNFSIARKLSEKAKDTKADLVVLAGDIYGYTEGKSGILKPFKEAGQKVLFVPGNCDFYKEYMELSEIGKNIDNYYVTYNGIGIVGIGSSNWKLNLNLSDFEKMKLNFEKMEPRKKILVSHLHAGGTLAEFSGFLGEPILRKAVEEFKPNLLISAHIHEAEGIEDKIGTTQVVQVGKNGKILEI